MDPKNYQVFFENKLIGNVDIYSNATREEIENGLKQFLKRDDLVFEIPNWHGPSRVIKIFKSIPRSITSPLNISPVTTFECSDESAFRIITSDRFDYTIPCDRLQQSGYLYDYFLSTQQNQIQLLVDNHVFKYIWLILNSDSDSIDENLNRFKSGLKTESVSFLSKLLNHILKFELEQEIYFVLELSKYIQIPERVLKQLLQPYYLVKQVSVGGRHILILTQAGQVYAYGFGINGQLGLGDDQNRRFPDLISFEEKIKQVSAGSNHSLILTETNQVYSFGSGYKGKLGLGENESNRYRPTLIPFEFGEQISQISAGGNHSLILMQSGQVYSFGDGEYGQLGLGDNQNKNIPTLIPFDRKIIQISAGYYHSLILDETNQVYSFGEGQYGQLGLGDYNIRNIPTLIPIQEKIIQISAGGNHSLILTETNQAYSFGRGNRGELGLGEDIVFYLNTPTLIPFNQNIKQISAGWRHSLILTQTDQVYSFGAGDYGRLGLGNNHDNRYIPTLIPIEFGEIRQFSAGTRTSLILTQMGEVYSMGDFANIISINMYEIVKTKMISN